jgi:hypothetical protein
MEQMVAGSGRTLPKPEQKGSRPGGGGARQDGEDGCGIDQGERRQGRAEGNGARGVIADTDGEDGSQLDTT